ncbi:MAG: ATP-binding protein [Candidatus Peribacteraceae bacterium]|nr:ATP-binding protein [Candidatus Peribacteraceae bacterium]
MKLHQQPYDIKSNGMGDSSNFQIEMTSKAFQILFEGIYQDREMAVVRELLCNAADAHVDADTLNIPVVVHLPNRIEPWFEVKDFGTGLSHDDVMQLYTTLFRSTKDMRNDMVGALGLGSKTPFAVGDTFMVSSRQNGTEFTYTAYLDAKKIPSITFIGTTDTDEANGLTVQVPVDESKLYTFVERLTTVLFAFDKKHRFNVVGYSGFTAKHYTDEDRLVKIVGSTIFREKANLYSKPNHYAVMGNIAYKLDVSKLTAETVKFLSSMTSSTYTDFPIGALDIQASREGLGYDDQTIKALEDATLNLENDLYSEIDDEISKVDTYWKAVVVLAGYNETIYKKFTDKRDFFWGGVKLKAESSVKSPYEITKRQRQDGSETVLHHPILQFEHWRKEHRSWRRERRESLHIRRVHEYTFIIKDLSAAYTKRIGYAHQNAKIGDDIIVVSTTHDNVDMEALLEMMEVPNIVFVSDLEKPVPVRSSVNDENIKSLMLFEGHSTWDKIYNKKTLEFKGKRVYYTPIKWTTPQEHKNGFLNRINDFYRDVVIVGVRGNGGLRIARELKWNDINDLIESFRFNENEIIKHAMSKVINDSLANSYHDHLVSFIKNNKENFDQDDFAVKTIIQLLEYESYRRDNKVRYDTIMAMCDDFGAVEYLVDQHINLAKQDIKKKYPLLDAIDGYRFPPEMSRHMVLYIKAATAEAKK